MATLLSSQGTHSLAHFKKHVTELETGTQQSTIKSNILYYELLVMINILRSMTS